MRSSKPKLGQNFLTSPAACMQIVEALGELQTRTVLEIGPGRGALTHLLASRAGRFIAVELDRALAPQLTEQWRDAAHVRIVEADILTLDLATLLPAGEKLVVVGNLPYYITSDILLHLFSQAERIERAVLMVQDEVADRIAARPGVREYGVLSATAQMHARVDKLFVVPPEAFSPPPKVHSAVVRLSMHPRFAELGVDRAGFLRFLQACFQQKRKTLVNNLKAAGMGNTDRILQAFTSSGIAPALRAEAVPLDTMAWLYRQLVSERNGSAS